MPQTFELGTSYTRTENGKMGIRYKGLPTMSLLHRVLWGGALCVLLGGSLLQAFGGSCGPGLSSAHSWGSDDAYISYRYAKNLIEGNGLVFNPGERVEAYSNFLYVLMVAPGFWATNNDGIYFFSLLLNLLFAGATFGLFTRYLQRHLSPGRALIGAWVIACCLPLWVAVASGMETALVLLISMAIWVLVERQVTSPSRNALIALAALMPLSLLARPDGFILPGVAILYLLLKRHFSVAAACTVAMLVVGGVHELWRYHYYGFLLPNTYYTKVTGPFSERLLHAFNQLKDAALTEGLLGLLLGWGLGLAEALRKPVANPRAIAEGLRFDLIFPAFWLAYWFYIGGDHFWDRFLIVLYPLGIFALLKYLPENAGPKTLAFLTAFLITLEVVPRLGQDPRFDYKFPKADVWIMTGKFLGQNYRGRTLATGALGKIGLFSGLYTEDLLGLADPIIAHRPASNVDFDPGHMKFDVDYSLGRRPDLIANWISPSGDLSLGITRSKYQAAGYHVEYLINSSRTPPAVPIVKVAGVDDLALQEWIRQGYDFALLTRQ